ncbi:hypothetical protein [Pseudomonas pseudonitroreducens]|uniref:hypothetical protein n=1 Tax=Pseudomonas pseudonitroreducens TaxID=2892326 RepID=UPI001F30A7F5|nr:hypothetical protein [Pseudomonas pseudonitroreducens]
MRESVEVAVKLLDSALEGFRAPGGGSFVGIRQASELLHAALERSKPAGLVQLDQRQGIVVNLQGISSMAFADSNGNRCLDIYMSNGEQYRVQHWPGLDGTDIYRLHRQITDALGMIS